MDSHLQWLYQELQVDSYDPPATHQEIKNLIFVRDEISCRYISADFLFVEIVTSRTDITQEDFLESRYIYDVALVYPRNSDRYRMELIDYSQIYNGVLKTFLIFKEVKAWREHADE